MYIKKKIFIYLFFLIDGYTQGFLHLFPNKGGLCVSFTIDATKFAFISCHLTAHEGVDKCESRNGCIQEIIGGVRSDIDDNRFDPTLLAHHVIWMGDMNYRVTFNKDTPKGKGVNKSAKNSGKKVEGTNEDQVSLIVDDENENENENENTDDHRSMFFFF
jgi:hypothetical protein